MGNELKLTAKVTNKSKTNKGIQLEGQEGWFSIPEKLTGFVAKINKGDNVDITYLKKGVFKNVLLIYSTKEEVKKEEPKAETTKSTTGFACSDCGKELKDDKYKKCYTCNQKAPVQTQVIEEKDKESGTGNKGKGYYDNPEKTAQIQRGNSLNAAAMVMSNPNVQMGDYSPEALAEATKTLAGSFLDWLRAE